MKPGQYLVVTADQNDADYVTNYIPITDKELEKFMPVIEAIKNFKPYKSVLESGSKWTHTHNWPKGEYCPREDLGEKHPKEIYSHIDPDLIERFDDEFVPYGEHGIHTIESIELVEIKSSKTLL